MLKTDLKILIIISILLSPELLISQQLAFPGAEGFGKYASGGRGGQVLEVTNLNDNGAGSLRSAIEAKGKRTVVFRVSGTIFLEKVLRVINGDLTIAGQTAPGDGITIANYPLVINTENIILRFIRCRLGDLKKTQNDAFSVTDSKNLIVDHCSFSWSVDETASCYKNKNFTMQWCIISESLYKSIHKKGKHGFGGIWGGDKATFHHNLLAHHTSRNPRFNGARYYANWNEQVDFRNNVIYNWGFNSSYGGDPSDMDGAKAKINIVNNYYKPGPATKTNEVQYRVLEPFTMKNYGYSNWFIDGNFMEGSPEVTKDNWSSGVQKVSDSAKKQMKSMVPFDFDITTRHTALEAFEMVLKYAGCRYPKMDRADTRIIDEARLGTATYGASYGTKTGIIDSQKDVGSWPDLSTLPPPLDSDHDGMPDKWEISYGLDPKDPSDCNKDRDNDGYSNLEEYINSLFN